MLVVYLSTSCTAGLSSCVWCGLVQCKSQRRVDDSRGCIDPSLLGFAMEKPAMVVVQVQGAPQWQKHWASIRLPLNLALAGVQVPRSQCCI
jgi:hypothetical protein